jgi:hypothetical protein
MTKRFEFVIPSLTEGQTKFTVEFECVRTRYFHRISNAIFGNDHVAHCVRLGKEDTEVWRVHPTPPIAASTRIFGDLKTEVLPATEGRSELGTGTVRPLPVELSALRTLEYGLIVPDEVHGTFKSATSRPLNMWAERARSRVHIEHSARVLCSHDISVPFGCDFPIDP